MIRRFFWVYLLVIVPTTLSVLMLKYSLDHIEHVAFQDSVRLHSGERFTNIVQLLQKTQIGGWARQVVELAEIYNPHKLSLSEYHAADWKYLGESEASRLNSGSVALHWPDMNHIDSVQRIPNSNFVLMMSGPVSDGARWWTNTIIVLLPSLVAAAMLFVWFRPFWNDVKEITAVADDIGNGNFDVKAHVSRHSTLAVVCDAINRMADEIRQLLQNTSDLSLAVAHDLKTPVTQLSLAVAILKDERDLSAVRMHAEGMAGDLAELDASIDEMLAAAQLERVAPFFPEHLRMKTFLAEIVEAVKLEASGPISTSGSVQLGATSEGEAYFDPRQMRRAVLNLVRNAVRHARFAVRVWASIEGSTTTIVVEDDGPGIPPDQRERMFEPFTRGEAVRRSHSPGYGLGLAIVQRIARLHGGIAQIEDAPFGGARIVIRW